MKPVSPEALGAIAGLPHLLAYLRDELGWPIPDGTPDELTFDWTADSLRVSGAQSEGNPPLQVRNATFAAIFANLLEASNFTVREDTPLNQDVAVDPEMLGEVFESIVLHAEAADDFGNAPDKRKGTGSCSSFRGCLRGSKRVP